MTKNNQEFFICGTRYTVLYNSSDGSVS